MNTFTGTLDDLQDYNSDNKPKENTISSNIEKFKNKIMGFLSLNPSKEKNNQNIKTKNINTADNNNITKKIQKAVKRNSKEKSNRLNTESLLIISAKNRENISKLTQKLKSENQLLSHFRKISEFIPDGASDSINDLEENIHTIEEELISLRMQNLKIDSKIKNKVKETSQNEPKLLNLEEIKQDKINKLDKKLKFEKNLLSHFEIYSEEDKETIMLLEANVKNIEDELIVLKINNIKKVNKKI